MESKNLKELEATLEDFGFSKTQSSVYLNLLALGPSTAGPLVRKTKLHRQLVYSALEYLESEKFVSVVVKNNRKVFAPTRPEYLVEKEKERMRRMELSIPLLQSLVPKANSQFNVDVMRGKEEFKRKLFALVDSAARTDKIVRVIGDVRDVDVYEAIGSSYSEYKQYAKEKKVKKRLIAPKSSVTSLYKERFLKEVGSELRISDLSSMPTSTAVTSEVVVFDIFSDEVTSIMIWNQTIAKSFKNHFDTLWKAAERYK